MKEKTKLIVLFGSAIAVSGAGLYLLYDYVKNQNSSILQKIKNSTNTTDSNLGAVSSATGSDLGYVQNEINNLQAQQLLNQTNPNITFGSVNGSSISAPTGSTISLSNQAPSYKTDLNNAGVNISGSSGNPNADSVKIPQLPSYSAGESL